LPNSQRDGTCRDGLVAAWVGCAGWEGCAGWLVLAAAVLAGSGGRLLGGRVPEPASAGTGVVAAALAEVAAAPVAAPDLRPARPGVDPLGPLAGSTMTRSGDLDALLCGGAGVPSPCCGPPTTRTATSAAAPVDVATASGAARPPDRRCRALLTSDLQVAPS
jgi:hypothetical protein